MFNKKLFFLVVMLILFFTIIIYVYRSVQEINSSVELFPLAVEEKVFEVVELKDQNQFKLLGDGIFTGSGFEPGFNFKLNLAGAKFGVDLVSKYGESKYVGYLDLESQSSSTKIFVGNVLDQVNKIQKMELKILTKKCFMPSGEEVAYTSIISVSDEKLQGCAELVK